MKFTNERTWPTAKLRNATYTQLVAEIAETTSITELDSLIAANDYDLDRFKRGDASDDQHGFNYYDAIQTEITNQRNYLNQKENYHGLQQ